MIVFVFFSLYIKEAPESQINFIRGTKFKNW